VVDASFTDRHAVTATGAVLVRPDGFVAWKSVTGETDDRAGLATALGAALVR
jgi:putative polyketide hydroxylase